MDDQELAILCAQVILSPDGRYIPMINLPMDLKERVKRFYQNEGRTRIEEHTAEIQARENQAKSGIEIRLMWDKEKGLQFISLGSAGLDLVEIGIPHFSEHNLGGTKTLIAA